MSSNTHQGTPQLPNESASDQKQITSSENPALEEALGANTLSPVEIKINDLVTRIASLEQQIATDGCDIADIEFQLSALQEELTAHLNGIEPALEQASTTEVEEALDNPIEPVSPIAEVVADSGLSANDGTLKGGIVDDVLETPAEDSTQVEQILENAENIANELANIEPAAGEDGGSSDGGSDAGGFGFQSTFAAGPIDPIDDVGPINPTQLEYGIEFQNDEVRPEEDEDPIRDEDDNPLLIKPDALNLDESNLNLNQAGKLEVDFGDDDAGAVTSNGVYNVTGSLKNILLTSNDVEVVIEKTNTGYTGTANGETVFNLTINPQTGDYNYEQLLPFDHADSSDPNDVIRLEFGVMVSDSDGDTDSTTITINVADDAPIANDDVNRFELEDTSTTGNVITGLNSGADAADNLSNDQTNTVTRISFEGNSIDVPTTGTASIDGQYGTLEIAADGSYTYTANNASETKEDCAELNPQKSDVDGIQDSLTKEGITVSVANDGDFDLTWVDTEDGSGLGIDNLNAKDSLKNWPKGETFDISFAEHASEVILTIAEIGDNNDDGKHGVDYTITFADGSTASGEQQFAPDQIVDGHLEFTLSGNDYDGKLIQSIALNSTNEGDYKGASFLLNNVEVKCPKIQDIKDVFEYTLADGDGDSSLALLTIEGNTAEYSIKKPINLREEWEEVTVPKETQQDNEKPLEVKDESPVSEDIEKDTEEAPIYDDAGAGELYGGAEANVIETDDPGEHFICQAVSMGIDVIRDFGADQGDVLDFSTLIQNYDPAQKAIDSFIFAREIDGGTILSVDVSGSGDAAKAVDLIALEGMKDIDLQAMVESGNISVM